MSIFKNLGPDLTEEHRELRLAGIAAQQEMLRSIVLRHGINISSAVRCEMSVSKCSYEDACVRFVQACEELTADMYWTEIGDFEQKQTAEPE